MKQHHSLGERHRAGGPGDDRCPGEQLTHAEQPQVIQQHDDVAARDQHQAALRELVPQLLALRLDEAPARFAQRIPERRFHRSCP